MCFSVKRRRDVIPDYSVKHHEIFLGIHRQSYCVIKVQQSNFTLFIAVLRHLLPCLAHPYFTVIKSTVNRVTFVSQGHSRCLADLCSRNLPAGTGTRVGRLCASALWKRLKRETQAGQMGFRPRDFVPQCPVFNEPQWSSHSLFP